MGSERAALGAAGERLAARHLERAGMTIVDRNWRCAVEDVRGELDLIARDGPTLVFCEVKTRRGRRAGGPLDALTADKQRRLRRLAGAWLAAHPCGGPVRFDVVGVTVPRGGGRTELVHLRGVL